MDAFFAAIEERDRPRLKGLPIVIGADPRDGRGRGVVSTANYKAREYGIHSAMPISQAWELSEKARRVGQPPAVFIETSGRHYSEVSAKIFNLIRKKVPKIEVLSIDEAFLDLSFLKNFEKAKEFCLALKKEIKTHEHLTCSIGLGSNKLIAKIASDFKKPDGLTLVGSDDKKNNQKQIEEFLDPLLIRKIPGIGPKTEGSLNNLGIKTIADLKKLSKEDLILNFGKWGLAIYEKARGIDDSVLSESEGTKSISEQETFSKDTLDSNFICDRLRVLLKGVYHQFETNNFKTFKTITLIIRFSDFKTKNRSHTLSSPAKDFKTLEFEALKLLYPFFDKRENPRHQLIRLVGLRIEKLN